MTSPTRPVRALFAVLAALSAALPGPLDAQAPIIFHHYSEGLSQASVVCIFQDSKGFMWFGTQDGLNRYDGYRTKIYKNDPDDSASISDNFVVFIGEDSAGTLWIGTLNNPRLINRFNRTAETFARIPREQVDMAAFRANSVNPPYVDPSGARWFGTGSSGGGLRRIDARTDDTTAFLHAGNDPHSLADDRVYSAAGDQSGRIWVATRGGLDRLDQKTGRFEHFIHDPADPDGLGDNFVWPLLVDTDGVLWAGTFQGGLHRYDETTGKFARYVHDEANERSIAGDRMFSLYQDRSGIIWVGLGDHGVDRFHPGLSNFGHVSADPAKPERLADNNILSMFVDSRGDVWVGTRSGLNRRDVLMGKSVLYKHDASRPGSIADDQVQAMLEDADGTLWIGTVSAGLDRLDRLERVKSSVNFKHYRHDPADPGSLPDNRVYALHQDRKGRLWVGTYGGGLAMMDKATGRFVRYRHDAKDPASLGAPGVWSILEDREGALWVGTLGGGLDRLDGLKPGGTEKSNAQGASGGGKPVFTHHRADPAVPGSISDNIIVCLFEDRAGNIWAGTTAGLNRYDRAAETFTVYREKDGLANYVVFGILEDGEGRLWMSTNKGISRFDPATNSFRNFGFGDGLQGDEFNQGAYAKDPRTGELYFGGPNGYNVFDPARITANPYVPPVVFTSFVRYNTDDEEGTPIDEPGIDDRRAVVLSYKDNVAVFEFSSLNYFNSERNRYAYRLAGYGEGWIQLGADRRATFTNLDGGEYVLQVRGSNNDGVWNEEGARLAITVTPPWWKTRWAYASYGILAIAFAFGAHRFEVNRREQKAAVRESNLRAKAAEAEKRALAAENERKTKELEDARRLQLSMLPDRVPDLADYEIAVHMKTSTEVGGDYYDFTPSPEGLDIAFGDATGHGMQAGTIVTLMKGLFVSDSNRFDIPSFFNHCSRTIKNIRLGRLFMALSLARLRGKNVSFSSAGMPPVFIYRAADGSVEEVLLKAVPLGSMKQFPYQLYETSMEAGDTALFLTDGLPEQKNAAGEMYDYARVVETFKASAALPPSEIIGRLVVSGEKWMEGAAQDDDITLMVVRRKTAGR